jgi:hypothetical protein
VLQRSYDTGGESFTVEILVRAGAAGYYTDYAGSPPEHVHDGQEETFVVRPRGPCVHGGGGGGGGGGDLRLRRAPLGAPAPEPGPPQHTAQPAP